MKQQSSNNKWKAIVRRYIIPFCLMITSCAQISTPTGGKRDSTPPVLVKAFPPSNSIHFHQKEVKMVFNEWIQPIQNANNQIIISPSIVPFPKIEAARNELTIKFKDSLQSNTTYSVFFGNNLKDNNEGNSLTDFKYIFSTGDFIDSLKVKGELKNALDKVPDNTYLLLYKQKEDSAFTTKHPFYITKINPDGTFNLENVKEGDYRIYALSDKNGNYFYDLPTEAIGFTDSLFHIQSDLQNLSFTLFQPEENSLRIFEFDRVINGGILHITFNKEISFNKDQLTVSVSGDSTLQPIAFPTQELNLQAKGGSITVYFPKMKMDTASLSLVIKNNGQLIDTLRVRMESRKFTKPVLFFTDTLSYHSLSVFESKPVKMVSPYYSLSNIDSSKIIITDTARQIISFHVSRDEDLHTYFFYAAWKSGMQYKLSIQDSAFSDLVGNYNKAQEIPFTVISSKKAGNLLITYELPSKEKTYIALLKDNSGKVSEKRILRDSQSVQINYGWMIPGTYTVEVIEDINNNGIWNSGNFTAKTLPEKIYKEIKPILVKENWDAEEKVKVDFNAIQKTAAAIDTSKTPVEKIIPKTNK